VLRPSRKGLMVTQWRKHKFVQSMRDALVAVPRRCAYQKRNSSQLLILKVRNLNALNAGSLDDENFFETHRAKNGDYDLEVNYTRTSDVPGQRTEAQN
jgi:hypothetical protein